MSSAHRYLDVLDRSRRLSEICAIYPQSKSRFRIYYVISKTYEILISG